MDDTSITPTGAKPLNIKLPWFVCVSPEYYYDADDTGFGWEGWAIDEDDAVRQALENCRLVNDRDPEDLDEDLDVNRAKVHVAEIDFRRFAGPLLHWSRERGGFDTPLWKAMEEAVRQASLTVAPLLLLSPDSKPNP
jgi:hypothetical protein